jgi:hypothetical protein
MVKLKNNWEIYKLKEKPEKIPYHEVDYLFFQEKLDDQ